MNTIFKAIFVLPAAAILQIGIVPNDPFFKYQTSFLNPGGKIVIERSSTKSSPVTLDAIAGIDADITRAWTISTGSKKVVVAILDDGFFYGHEDLAGNIWANPGRTRPDIPRRPTASASPESIGRFR
jgi:subtilisin family serine protease